MQKLGYTQTLSQCHVNGSSSLKIYKNPNAQKCILYLFTILTIKKYFTPEIKIKVIT